MVYWWDFIYVYYYVSTSLRELLSEKCVSNTLDAFINKTSYYRATVIIFNATFSTSCSGSASYLIEINNIGLDVYSQEYFLRHYLNTLGFILLTK
jgi:hypothetical protein